MPTDTAERWPCSSCAEPIKRGARVCPQCGASQAGGWTGARVLALAGALVTLLSLVFALQRVYEAWSDYSTRQQGLLDQVQSARVLLEKGSYDGAWDLLEAAQGTDPTSPLVRSAQIEVAAGWLVSGFRSERYWGGDGPASICARVHPQLVIANVLAEGEERADLEALIAWSNLIRGQARIIPERDLEADFRRAAAVWPESFYANLLLGYWLSSAGADPIEALESWDRALASGRDDELVRSMAVRMLSGRAVPAGAKGHPKRRALLLVLDAMQRNGEPYPTKALGSSSYAKLYVDEMRAEEHFDAILPSLPIDRHVALGEWVFEAVREELERPSNRFRIPVLIYIQARLLEEAGRPEEALEVVRRADGQSGARRMQPLVDALFQRLTNEPPPGLYERNPWLLHAHRFSSEAADSPAFQESLQVLLELRDELRYAGRLDRDQRDAIQQSLDAAIASLEDWKARPGMAAKPRAETEETLVELRYMRGALHLELGRFEEGLRELEYLAELKLERKDHAFVLFTLAGAYAYSDRAPMEVYDDTDWQIRAAYLYEGLDRLAAALEAGYDDWEAIESQLKRLRELPEYASLSLRYGRVPPRDDEEG